MKLTMKPHRFELSVFGICLQFVFCHLGFRALLLLFALATQLQAADEPLELGGVTERHEMIPMRDGVRLSAYLYTPPGEGPWPAILEQRYASVRDPGTRKMYARLAAAGYVVAAANFRGAQESEGTWVGYRALGWGELKDGYDLVEWLAAQKWCTGKIGTLGSSQAGFAQNFLAVTQPPHLTAQYMIDTGLSLYHEGYRIGGGWRPERFKGMEKVCRVPQHNRDLIAEWIKHPNYDEYWRQEDCSKYFDKMNVPCFTIGSWFDFMSVGSIDSYIGRQHQGGKNSRGAQQLLLGPWLHGRVKEVNVTGELTFPENARFPLEQHILKWFDHYLRGKDNGVERDPAVRYYAMGAMGEPNAPGNDWRTADDWPAKTSPTNYFLAPRGQLCTKYPSAVSEETIVADPRNPAPIPGIAFPGGRDQRKFEEHPHVRTFTTEPLQAPVEWTGKLRAELFVKCDALDADYIVRITDVYPDGRSILLLDYLRRARYREGFEKEVPLEPGVTTPIAFDLGSISQVFNAGHRIRVTVASSGAPFYEPNPNTGGPLTMDLPADARVATSQVLMSPRFSSRIIAPQWEKD